MTIVAVGYGRQYSPLPAAVRHGEAVTEGVVPSDVSILEITITMRSLTKILERPLMMSFMKRRLCLTRSKALVMSIMHMPLSFGLCL